MTRKLLTLLLILTILFAACSPPIAGDAGTYAEPTPPSGVWQVESDQHEWRIEQKQTREAR